MCKQRYYRHPINLLNLKVVTDATYLVCQQTFVQKPIHETRMQHWHWNTSPDFMAKEMWVAFKFTRVESFGLLRLGKG